MILQACNGRSHVGAGGGKRPPPHLVLFFKIRYRIFFSEKIYRDLCVEFKISGYLSINFSFSLLLILFT